MGKQIEGLEFASAIRVRNVVISHAVKLFRERVKAIGPFEEYGLEAEVKEFERRLREI